MKPVWKAALTSAALSALFVAVYSSCNAITSLRPHVGSFYFAWERRIPFVPAAHHPLHVHRPVLHRRAPFLAAVGPRTPHARRF